MPLFVKSDNAKQLRPCGCLLEFSHGVQCLLDFVPEIRRITTQGFGVAISPSMLRRAFRGWCCLDLRRVQRERPSVRRCCGKQTIRELGSSLRIITDYETTSSGAGSLKNGIFCGSFSATRRLGKPPVLDSCSLSRHCSYILPKAYPVLTLPN